MGKSNAQRQAEYRQRHLRDENATGERLNFVVSVQAKRRLERLASFYGVTQRAMLEKLLEKAEHAALDRAAGLPGGYEGYYEKRSRAPNPLCSNEGAPAPE